MGVTRPVGVAINPDNDGEPGARGEFTPLSYLSHPEEKAGRVPSHPPRKKTVRGDFTIDVLMT